MMRLRVTRIGYESAVAFAVDELNAYLRKMDPTLHVEEFLCETYEEYLEEPTNSIVVGVDIGVEKAADDQICISIENGKGVITGPNPRSVLFSVYRLLYLMGCRFPSPELSSEVIPAKKFTPADFTYTHNSVPAFRHRGVDSGGTVDYQAVANFINWMPKLGLNSYFIEYLYPVQNFARAYKQDGETVSRLESRRIQKRLEDEIKKRDMDYHAAGHNWQNDPFGIPGDTYGKREGFQIPEDVKNYVALVNGKRELIHGNPLETNMCYTNPEVRKIMIDAMVQYCLDNPRVDYLHVWLSDGANGMCECENCRKSTAADQYLVLLNELDERMTEMGIPTKVVFTHYCDLYWPPETERFRNPDRFAFVASLAHSYSKPLNRFDREPNVQPYKLNQNRIPKTNEDSITSMRMWQEIFKGDSFLFDFNQIWDHYKDPGYMACARRITEDAIVLKELGLNGLYSCQFNNVGFPSWLPSYCHGLTMWDPTLTFDEIADEYFTAIYGDTADKARAWLEELSERFDPPYLRHEKPRRSPEHVKRYLELEADIRKKLPELEELAKTSEPWSRLAYHAKLSAQLARALSCYADSNLQVRDEMEKLKAMAYERWDEVFDYMDVLFYTVILGMVTDSSAGDFVREVETEI